MSRNILIHKTNVGFDIYRRFVIKLSSTLKIHYPSSIYKPAPVNLSHYIEEQPYKEY